VQWPPAARVLDVPQIKLPSAGVIRSGTLKRATNYSQKVLVENRTLLLDPSPISLDCFSLRESLKIRSQAPASANQRRYAGKPTITVSALDAIRSSLRRYDSDSLGRGIGNPAVGPRGMPDFDLS